MRRVVPFLLSVALLGAHIFAGGGSGGKSASSVVTGQVSVKDYPAPNVSVVLSGSSTGLQVATYTDSLGQFTIHPPLGDGVSVVSYSLDVYWGRMLVAQKRLQIAPGAVLSVPISLK
jgi:hypothetical protein